MPRARHLRRARRRVGPAGGRPEAQIPLKPTRGRGPLTFQGRTQTLTKRLLLPSERPPNTCQHLPKHLNLAENTCAPQYPHVRLPLSAPLSLPPPNAALYAEIFWFVLLLAPFRLAQDLASPPHLSQALHWKHTSSRIPRFNRDVSKHNPYLYYPPRLLPILGYSDSP